MPQLTLGIDTISTVKWNLLACCSVVGSSWGLEPSTTKRGLYVRRLLIYVKGGTRSGRSLLRRRGVRCMARSPSPHATSSFSFANATLSRNVCIGVLP